METTKEELEKKWWHRLTNVIIGLLTASFFVLFLKISFGFFILDSIGAVIITVLLFGVPLSICVFLLLRFLYYYVILYVVFGRKKKQKKTYEPKN